MPAIGVIATYSAGMSEAYDVTGVRRRFPALTRVEDGETVAYLDGPGGTQVPTSVIDAMTGALGHGVSNLGGGFGASESAGDITDGARAAMARFFGTSPAEVSFGQNMTSLTFALSRSLARTWRNGDSIVLTSLDHDANFTPWAMAAEETGVTVRVAEFDTSSGILHSTAVTDLIDSSTRLVAVCLASNALGTVVDVAAIAAAAHQAGAKVFVDAVHAGPHLRIDAEPADFLVASSYKFFGPHTGVLFGRADHMEALNAYKVRPAPSAPPDKWETGTQSFESLAGVSAAVEHIESLGSGSVDAGFEVIGRHERSLGQRFLDGIAGMGHVALHGLPEMSSQRVATFAVGVKGKHPEEVARRFSTRGVYVWAGHYYALNVMDRLGVLDDGGLVRIGFCHYNTMEEVDRALEVLDALSAP